MEAVLWQAIVRFCCAGRWTVLAIVVVITTLVALKSFQDQAGL